MVKRAIEDFWNASHAVEKKPEIQPQDNRAIRDKDNTDHRIKPPSFAPHGETNRAPQGMSGIKRGLGTQKQETLPSIAKTYPQPALLTEGYFMDNPDHKFLVAIDPYKSPAGLHGGKMTNFEIQHEGSILVQFKEGHWTKGPDTPAQKNMVDRLQNEFGGKDKEFTPLVQPDYDKDHGHGR